MSKQNEWVHVISVDGIDIAVPAHDITYHRACHLVYWNGVRYKSSKTAWELVRQMPNAFVVR